jgi:glycosyltransferase involved in cell wall biosynthesis
MTMLIIILPDFIGGKFWLTLIVRVISKSMGIGISCKCITYGRVDLLEESLYSFLNQDYDFDSELVIVNDYPEQRLFFDHPKVKIINLDETFKTIGEKENFAIENCKYDTIAVWDDDDIALPNHLKNINKYFPGYDLLHWKKGAAVNFKKIDALHGLGNSGIVYTKEIWERSGKHELENAGYDMSFVVKIRQKYQCRVVNADPPDEEVSWMYLWGGRSYHMSGLGADTPDRDNVIIRHSKHVEKLKNAGKIPIGDIELNPKWNIDYKQLLTNFVNENNSSIGDA